MHAILDVHYSRNTAVAGCVTFEDWSDRAPGSTTIAVLPVPSTYLPGQFYERELPCLLAVLEKLDQPFESLIIDGFVHLKAPLHKGLGVHLAEAMNYGPAIIGVAKNPLRVADRYVPIIRGRSRKPLYISAINFPLPLAAKRIAGMHGSNRIPTLIGAADRLCRRGIWRKQTSPDLDSDCLSGYTQRK